jgi:osmotically inducible protein OsmC
MERKASAIWKGGLKDGKGSVSSASTVLNNTPYSFSTRFENTPGTNPEELIAAAHASCFTMQLSFFLQEAGHPAARLTTSAEVTVGPVEGKGNTISKSALTLRGDVPGMEEAQFLALAKKAKESCPVSRALDAIEITLDAKLEA